MEVQLRLDGQGRTTWDPPATKDSSESTTVDADRPVIGTTASDIDYVPKAVMTSSLASPSSDSSREAQENWQTWMDNILFDCEIADCGLMPRTFWMPADGTQPRCDLEDMALQVFRHHVPKNCAFDPSTSGAEWWIQLRPSPPGMGRYAMHDTEPDDMSKSGISFHWDKDEDLRLMAGGSLYVHPHLSTVTYLTSLGAPTVVLNCRVHPMTGTWLVPGTKDHQVEDYVESLVSWPKQGKHLSFDGRFLHAAPPDLMEDASFERQCSIPEDLLGSNDDTKEDAEKVRKVVERRHRRVTFLVNVWLNYRPFNVHAFPDTMLDKLTRSDAIVENQSSLFRDSNREKEKTRVVEVDKAMAREVFECNSTCSRRGNPETESTVSFTWPMGGSESNEVIQADIPLKLVRQESASGGNLRIHWGKGGASGVLLSKRESTNIEDTKDDDHQHGKSHTDGTTSEISLGSHYKPVGEAKSHQSKRPRRSDDSTQTPS